MAGTTKMYEEQSNTIKIDGYIIEHRMRAYITNNILSSYIVKRYLKIDRN